MRRTRATAHAGSGIICRATCASACGTIHYQNPRLVVGCVPEHEGSILLCRRAIEPRRGYWTVPAGFMENGETLAAGGGARVAGGGAGRGSTSARC